MWSRNLNLGKGILKKNDISLGWKTLEYKSESLHLREA